MEKEEYTIDSQLKDQINSEGWEDADGKESYCGLLIGKKENGELSNLLERLETDGKAKDLATYIRLNKKIIVPNKEVSNDLSNYVGGYFLESWDLFYIDKDKNICTVRIDSTKIDSLGEKRRHYYVSEYAPILHNELAKLGFEEFNISNKMWNIESIESILKTYENKLKDAKKEEIKQDFNF